MTKNTGKPTEALFEASLDALGKAAYYYRIKDAAAIRGMTGQIGRGVDATPSDYICVVKGKTFFGEVKSTQHPTLFEFKLLKKGQNSHATRILAAGGGYLVVIHRLLTGDWYVVSKDALVRHETMTGRKSMSWDEMESCRCTLEKTRAGTRPQW